ncbi:unnamed protein product [Phaeothamnion confervicola]
MDKGGLMTVPAAVVATSAAASDAELLGRAVQSMARIDSAALTSETGTTTAAAGGKGSGYAAPELWGVVGHGRRGAALATLAAAALHPRVKMLVVLGAPPAESKAAAALGGRMYSVVVTAGATVSLTVETTAAAGTTADNGESGDTAAAAAPPASPTSCEADAGSDAMAAGADAFAMADAKLVALPHASLMDLVTKPALEPEIAGSEAGGGAAGATNLAVPHSGKTAGNCSGGDGSGGRGGHDSNNGRADAPPAKAEDALAAFAAKAAKSASTAAAAAPFVIVAAELREGLGSCGYAELMAEAEEFMKDSDDVTVHVDRDRRWTVFRPRIRRRSGGEGTANGTATTGSGAGAGAASAAGAAGTAPAAVAETAVTTVTAVKAGLVFHHGATCPAEAYAALLHALAARGYLCVSVAAVGRDARNRVGAAREVVTALSATAAAEAAANDKIGTADIGTAAIATGGSSGSVPKRWFVGGHSMGGGAAIKFALELQWETDGEAVEPSPPSLPPVSGESPPEVETSPLPSATGFRPGSVEGIVLFAGGPYGYGVRAADAPGARHLPCLQVFGTEDRFNGVLSGPFTDPMRYVDLYLRPVLPIEYITAVRVVGGSHYGWGHYGKQKNYAFSRIPREEQIARGVATADVWMEAVLAGTRQLEPAFQDV